MLRNALMVSILLLAGVVAFSEESRVDSILASVNGAPVSLLDVILEGGKREARLTAIYKGSELRGAVLKHRREVVDQIIERRLIYQEFQKKEFELPPQLVEDAIGELATAISDGSVDGLRQKAKELGVEFDELKEKAREKVACEGMISQFCFRDVNVTPKETYEYYRDHASDYAREGRWRLRCVLIRRGGRHKGREMEVIKEIEDQIRPGMGDTFARLARKYSENSGADEDGNLGWVGESKARPEFAAALKGAKTGDIVGPVDTPEGWYLLYVADHKPGTTIPFAKVKETINDDLTVKQRMENYRKYVDDLKKKALIRYYF